MKLSPAVREYMSALGKRGKGKSKARTSEQARAAVKARWDKVRKQTDTSVKPL